MGKIVRTIAGVVVIGGIVVVGGAWYSGKQIAEFRPAHAQQMNDLIRTQLQGSNLEASVALESMKSGFFTSTATYKLTMAANLSGGASRFEREFLVREKIQHGPIPVGRLLTLRLAPVMYSYDWDLVRNESADRLFELTNGKSPLFGKGTMSYGKTETMTTNSLPLEFDLSHFVEGAPQMTISLSAMKGTSSLNVGSRSGSTEFSLDKLEMRDIEGEDGYVRLQGFTAQSDMVYGPLGFGSGKGKFRLKEMIVAPEDEGEFKVVGKDVGGTVESSETDGRLSGKYDTSVADFLVNEDSFGGINIVMSMRNLDAAALRELQLNQKTLLDDGYDPQEVFSDESMRPIYMTMLESAPEFNLDRLAFKTAGGESVISLKMQLGKPQSLDLPPGDLLRQLFTSVDLDVKLSKPMMRDWGRIIAPRVGKSDSEVDGAIEAAGGFAVMMQLGKVEGENIVSRLKYANGMIDLNGRTMPPEDFLKETVGSMLGGMFGGGAPAGGSHMLPDDDDDDDIMIDEEYLLEEEDE